MIFQKVDSLKFPIIIKPVDSFSGKGTNKKLKIYNIHQNIGIKQKNFQNQVQL